MKRYVISAALMIFGAAEPVSAAEPEATPTAISSAVIGLRGGFDANPTSVKGERGSPVLTSFATWDYLSGTAKDGFGLNLVLVETQYDPRVLAAGRAYSLMLKHGFSITDTLAVQSSLTAADEQSWSRRKSSLALKQRIDAGFGAVRLFATGEAKVSALNERNIFNLGGFLPQDENFGTLSLTPGAAWRMGETEIGVSFAASRVHFLDGVDYLGLRRDHNRLQPNLFASTTVGPVTLEGSLSPFRAIFPEKEFETVETLLYTAKAKLPYDRFTLELSSGRTVEDTTLPFSVINLVTGHEAKLTAQIDEKNAVSLVARQKTDDYLGLDAKSDSRSIGLDYQRALAPGLTATASVGVRKVKETGLTPISAFSLLFGLQKQIDFRGLGRAGKAGA